MATYTFEIPEEITWFMRQELKVEPEAFLIKQLDDVFAKYKEWSKQKKLETIDQEVATGVAEIKGRTKAEKLNDKEIKAIKDSKK